MACRVRPIHLQSAQQLHFPFLLNESQGEDPPSAANPHNWQLIAAYPSPAAVHNSGQAVQSKGAHSPTTVAAPTKSRRSMNLTVHPRTHFSPARRSSRLYCLATPGMLR